MTLNERLKYWHLYCMNCGNFLFTILKEFRKSVDRDDVCSDCNKKIHTRINCKTSVKLVVNNNDQWNIIGCKLDFHKYK